ncbi:MAG: type IV toxin-antitoxin system AbiEi family antitoxin domain-containing protein [Verrucomicrobiales bacterium]|nr:type IV toxin-antitoxin system AbiEi family antitoxin domain-containing protein [Verrucomicrobiales bacterium]
MGKALRQQMITLFQRSGLVRPREVERAGLPRWVLYELINEGVVTRRGRGVYALTDAAVSENHSYAEAVKRAPKGIICLLSALRFHGLTMQNPVEVWIAVPHGSWLPKSDDLQLRIVRFTGKALTTGVEVHQVEGIPVPVTNVARTIADCFKFRNKVGTNVAVEALHDAWRKERFKMDELWDHAKTLRMSRVMMPYLETLP